MKANQRSPVLYSAPFPRGALTEMIGQIGELGWRPALRQMVGTLPVHQQRAVMTSLSEDRAAWKYLLNASKTKTVLNYGCAFGATSLALARSFGKVVSLDPNSETLLFLKQWSEQSGVENMAFVKGGDARSLPFPDACFDVAVLNGVLDRFPFGVAQFGMLKEVCRTLRPDGECYIGTENRFSYETFINKTPQRNYSHSILGYKKLLRKAGFKTHRFFAPYPDSKKFSQLRGLPGSGRTRPTLMRPKNASVKSTLLSSRVLRGFAPSFSIVASKSSELQSFAEQLVFDALKTVQGIDAEEWIIKHFGVSSGKVFIILGSRTGNDPKTYPFIIKIPMTPYSDRRLQQNVDTLTAIRSSQTVSESLRSRIPRNITSGTFRGQSYFVEQRVPGSDGESLALVRSQRDTLLRSALGILTELHQTTSNLATRDEPTFHDQFVTPMMDVANFVGHDTGCEAFKKVTTSLEKMALGRSLPLVWSHGDFSLKNLLVDETSLDILGMIDWDLSSKVSLPLIDLLHLLVRAKMTQERTSFEATLFNHLFPLRLEGIEGEILAEYVETLSIDPSLVPSLSVMYWLSRVHGHVGSDKDLDAEWVDRNFTRCLHELGRRL